MRSFAQEKNEISRYSEKVDETLKLGLQQAVSFFCLISLSLSLSLLQLLISALFSCRKWLDFSLEV